MGARLINTSITVDRFTLRERTDGGVTINTGSMVSWQDHIDL